MDYVRGFDRHQLASSSRTLAAKLRRPDVNHSYIVPVLSKAIRIIQLIESSDRPLNIDEISRETGIAKSTTYRVLRTLSAHGYLPGGADGVYAFGAALLGQPTRRTGDARETRGVLMTHVESLPPDAALLPRTHRSSGDNDTHSAAT